MTNDLHHLAAAYALDALDDEERRAFEAHYPTCEICRQEVLDFRETAGHLASVAAVDPPEALRARVMSSIGETRQVSPIVDDSTASVPPPVHEPVAEPDDSGTVVDLGERRRRRSLTMVLASAAAVLLIAIGAIVVVGSRGGSDLDDVLAASDAVVTALDPQLDGQGGSVRLVWSATLGRVALFGDGLAASGEGLTYELWSLDGDVPVPAGLFEPDDGAVREVLDVDDLDADGWGITIEPDGGSPQPTSDILFLGLN